MEKQDDLKILSSAIEDISFAMLGTIGDEKSIHCRPMATLSLEHFQADHTLWFFSKRNSQKITEIENDQRVTVTYTNPNQHRYVSVYGEAVITEDPDRIKAYWKPSMKIWFPDGPEDPDLSLIGVRVKNAEVWDSSNTSFHQMLGFVRSTLTGRPFDLDIHSRQINLEQ